jgi:predicted GNAT family acetyltransferase
MPTLADIYSAINTFKRKSSDFVQNPGTSLEQMLFAANENAREFNKKHALATDYTIAQARGQQPTPEQTQAEMGLRDAMAGAYNPGGIISKTLATKFPNVAVDIFESPKAIDLSKIVVPKELRNQGLGSSVMQDLIDYADSTGKQVRLSPSSDFGGSPTRLKKFYKEFGFVDNRGRNKDFTTRETMIRSPEEKSFEVTRKDASEIFGQGAERVKYLDPKSNGTIEVLVKPDGTASVLGLEVPEKFRGLGIGQSLQNKAMKDFSELQGQVSSKAAATTAYKLGRRPPFQPNATLQDVYKLMDENSSVNLVSPKMQTRFQQEQ